jgi:hypothetical protein
VTKECITAASIFAASAAFAETINFDSDSPGGLPAGWEQGVTGKGNPKWAVRADVGAPSKPNVLEQSGSGTFPWCVNRDVSREDGFVEVKFKPVAGREDQAGGLVWRWKDGEHYYVARANALENNVSLYYTEAGSRKTIKYVDAPVERNRWHSLRIEYAGRHIKVVFDGQTRIELDDSHISGPGAIGVWTKADSVTLFDDFRHGTLR